MDLAETMDAIATRLKTITGLRVQAWPADAVNPPAAVVTYPATYTFDATYGRGSDRMDPQVVILVGGAFKKTTRDLITEYARGTGPKSVKAVLESAEYDFTIRVANIEFEAVTIGGVELMAARFTLDIYGQGD